jgi:hypothetical protein
LSSKKNENRNRKNHAFALKHLTAQESMLRAHGKYASCQELHKTLASTSFQPVGNTQSPPMMSEKID